MRYSKRLIVLSFSLVALIIAVATLTGMSLARQLLKPQQSVAEPLTLGTDFNASPAGELQVFAFGDNAGQAILLELINAQADEETVQYTLTTAPAGSHQLRPAELADQQLVCSGTILAATIAETESATPLKKLEMFGASWLPSFDNSYEINLWNPSGQYEEYVLASSDGKNGIEHCSHFVDEDV